MAIRFPLAALALLATLPCVAADSPKADIQQVVDRFQQALKAHDAKGLGSLFLPESTAWLMVPGEATLRKVRQKHPEAKPYETGTWQKFAGFVGDTSRGDMEERFHNVRIETDGTVGSVYFDFEFVMDGKIQNRGAETWQMVRTTDGWKIAAMLYSTNF